MKLRLCGELGGDSFDDCLDCKGADTEPAAEDTKTV